MQSYTWLLNVGFIVFLVVAYFFYYKVITFMLAVLHNPTKIRPSLVWVILAHFERFLMVAVNNLTQYTLLRGTAHWTAQYNRLLRRK